ncbi:hypothetical protein PT2222_500015 [Paraburkholderia tropica]
MAHLSTHEHNPQPGRLRHLYRENLCRLSNKKTPRLEIVSFKQRGHYRRINEVTQAMVISLQGCSGSPISISLFKPDWISDGIHMLHGVHAGRSGYLRQSLIHRPR